MKINLGDIYRDQISKYNFVSKYTSNKILDLTFGKYLDFRKSELLLSKNIKEVWSLDLLNNDQYLTVRTLNDEQKICFEKKPLKELKNIKFDLIVSFNTLHVTYDIDAILIFFKNYLSSTGVVIVSILNNDIFLNSQNNLNSTNQKLLSISNFKKTLTIYFKSISLFSQGNINEINNYSKNVNTSSYNNSNSSIMNNLKNFFKTGEKTNSHTYLKYITFLYVNYKKFRRKRKFKIHSKIYEITSYDNTNTSISVIAVCKNLIF